MKGLIPAASGALICRHPGLTGLSCFSSLSLSQGSRSTRCHSWSCRRSTGCGFSSAPYLEIARYYSGMFCVSIAT